MKPYHGSSLYAWASLISASMHGHLAGSGYIILLILGPSAGVGAAEVEAVNVEASFLEAGAQLRDYSGSGKLARTLFCDHNWRVHILLESSLHTDAEALFWKAWSSELVRDHTGKSTLVYTPLY